MFYQPLKLYLSYFLPLQLPKKEIPRSEPEKKKKTAQEKPVTLQKLAKVSTSVYNLKSYSGL